MIKLSGLKMMGDLIMITYDETGRRYDLPPFVINEPEKYGTPKEAPKIPSNYHEKMMSFKIRCTRFSDFDITIGSLMTIQQVKGRYAEHYNLNWEKVRLFYNGRECKNQLTLVQCGVEEGVVIQAAVGI
jgi:hypothetical protein